MTSLRERVAFVMIKVVRFQCDFESTPCLVTVVTKVTGCSCPVTLIAAYSRCFSPGHNIIMKEEKKQVRCACGHHCPRVSLAARLQLSFGRVGGPRKCQCE